MLAKSLNFKVETINELKREFRFKDTYNLLKDLQYIAKFLEDFNQLSLYHPRISDIKNNLCDLAIHLNNLLTKLESTLPIVLKEFDVKYALIYPQRQFKDIVTSSSKIRLELKHLYALCHLISTEIGPDFSKSLMSLINNLLACFKNGGVTISEMLNAAIPIENLTSTELGFTITLKQSLKLLIDCCEKLIQDLGKDSGRLYNSLARNFLLKIAVTYLKGTGKKPTAYKSIYTDSGYDGAFYNFAMACSSLFNHPDLLFKDSPAFVGDMAIESIKHLKELAQDS